MGALLLGPDGAFITSNDFLMDAGVTASYFYGELAPQRPVELAAWIRDQRRAQLTRGLESMSRRTARP